MRVLLAKDQQSEALQKDCQKLQAKLSSERITPICSISIILNICYKILREKCYSYKDRSPKSLRDSLQTSKIIPNGYSSSVIMQEASSTINVCLENSSLAKTTPKTVNILKKDAEWQALPLGNEAIRTIKRAL